MSDPSDRSPSDRSPSNPNDNPHTPATILHRDERVTVYASGSISASFTNETEARAAIASLRLVRQRCLIIVEDIDGAIASIESEIEAGTCGVLDDGGGEGGAQADDYE